MTIRRNTVAALTAAGALALTATATAHAGDPGAAHVTSGEFTTLPGGVGLGYSIDGHATMVRFADRTLVTVHVRGLDPETTYPAHVHDAPCSNLPPGGGHYQHDVGGPVDPVNEIWPIVTTNDGGNGLGRATHAHRARADAQSIVIHYPVDTSVRLACVDLT